MGDNAVAHLPRKVQPAAVFFERIDNPQTLPVVGEAAGAELVERAFPRMAEGSMAEVMPQGDGFGQVFVQAQRAGDGAGDLADFQRVGQPGAVMVAFRRKKDLRFLLEPSERLAVQNPITVALVARAQRVFRLRSAAAAAALAQSGVAAQGQPFDGLGLFTDSHGQPPFQIGAGRRCAKPRKRRKAPGTSLL